MQNVCTVPPDVWIEDVQTAARGMLTEICARSSFLIPAQMDRLRYVMRV